MSNIVLLRNAVHVLHKSTAFLKASRVYQSCTRGSTRLNSQPSPPTPPPTLSADSKSSNPSLTPSLTPIVSPSLIPSSALTSIADSQNLSSCKGIPEHEHEQEHESEMPPRDMEDIRASLRKACDASDVDRYILIKYLGSGSFGTVIEALDTQNDNRRVALKIIDTTHDWDVQEAIKEALLLRSASMLAPQCFPKFLRLLKPKDVSSMLIQGRDAYKERGALVISMELMTGGSLFDYYTSDANDATPCGNIRGNMSKCREIARSLLMGLSVLHDQLGVVHCDISTKNLFVSNRNGMDRLLVGDLGCAKIIGHELKSMMERPLYCVTRWYRAPELWCKLDSGDDYGYYDYTVDIWAAACVIFECFTGKPLFPCSDIDDFANQVVTLNGAPIRNIKSMNLPCTVKSALQHVVPHKVSNNCKLNTQNTVAGRLSSMFHAVSNNDAECRHLADLLAGMLSVDARHRPSAEDCLRHPFFTPIINSKRKAEHIASFDADMNSTHLTQKLRPGKAGRTSHYHPLAARRSRELSKEVVAMYHTLKQQSTTALHVASNNSRVCTQHHTLKNKI